MAWVAVAGAGVSLAGKAFGAWKGGQANKANQKLVTQERERNDAEYNNNAKQDFLNTNVAKGIVTEMKNANTDQQKAVAGRGVITGASDEANVAGQTGVHRNFTEGLSRLAGNATAWQNQQLAMNRSGRSILNQQQIGINNNRADSAANLVDNAGQLVTSIGGTAMLKGPKAGETTPPASQANNANTGAVSAPVPDYENVRNY